MVSPKAFIPIEEHQVPARVKEIRLQDYAVGVFRTISSRKGVKNAIKKGLVHVDGEKGYTGDWIRGGEIILLFQNSEEKKPIIDFKLEVLFEDDFLAVVNKPAGILVSGNKRFTVENALNFNLKKSTRPDALLRAEPIHRLDYPTTGALLVGKTAAGVHQLNSLFERRHILKKYCAVTIGSMNPEFTIEKEIDGKSSVSHGMVLQSIPSEKFQFLNLVELQPETGRRHQLRKHLASIGNPIFGDAVYGTEGLILKGKGLYLHAVSLEFEHPETKETIIVEAPLPKKFKKLFP